MTDVTTDSANLPSAGQFFEVGNYAPVPDEITEHNLPIEGAIPPETTAGTAQRAQSAQNRSATGSPATE